jgi:uncharacterized Zn finger protein
MLLKIIHTFSNFRKINAMENPSKCPKCFNSEFEAVNEKPVNSNFELIFVRCVNCSTVVGVIDYYNVGALIKKLASKLKINLDEQ